MLVSETNLAVLYPFLSKSSLQKDRLDARLGIPYHPIGGRVFYETADVDIWLAGLPVIVPSRKQTKPALGRRGKPSKAESVAAQRAGVTVPQLRARENEACRTPK